ncbi:hypothetical protein I5677_13285 [Mobilitalea sibirica]|uniref:Uncharacterized protein n=1 Tax=Mobilitalea sibirica TaxID=1462919 RepID=A0A8J7HBR5_9FIRM|nr:hypothetical protein [Mobilitalea sibirica]MBH1941870.1 hypothetical protein [Mobilitalea sibirica]
MKDTNFVCPICSSKDLTLQHEASYVYSYKIDSDAPGLQNKEEFLSYLYDRREQKDSRYYIQCNHCGTQYPYSIFRESLKQGENDFII